MDPMMNNPVLIRWLKVAICCMALGWGVSPASADVHRYLYELSTKSGEYLYAGEMPTGAKSPTKCVDVTTDGLGRITQVVWQVNGKMTSETIYQFEAGAKLPSGFESIAANGERISQNRIQRNDHGDRVRVDQFTMAGELAEYVIRKVGSDNVEELTYTALGKPKGDRVVNYYSPAGILARMRQFVGGTVSYEEEYDVSNGLRQSEKKFKNDELGYFTKIAYDDSGEILREDMYSSNSLWYGEAEYADDLLMVRKYEFPGGRNQESRFSYDDKRQLKEASFYHNEQLICIFKYDRLPTGDIKRTIAIGPNGQVFAVYPGLEVDEIDPQGHALDQPDVGTIYRQGDWWSRPMMSFGRADGDGAMP
jgi:antitoxin component YwqK of YwqJK toxin-antitoxin module